MTETYLKKKTVQTPGTFESRLDAEMADILQSDKEEFEKSILYNQIFQRFLQHRASTSMDHNLKVEKLQHEVEEMEAARNFDDNIIETLPKKFQEKAKSFLMFARKVSSVEWDSEGKVRVRGIPLPGASIVDLVNDAMRSRKRFRAAGRGQFCAALRAAGLSKNFVGNQEFWREGVVVAPHTSSASHSILTSPLHSASTPLRKNKTLASVNDSTFKDAIDAGDSSPIDSASSSNTSPTAAAAAATTANKSLKRKKINQNVSGRSSSFRAAAASSPIKQWSRFK